MYLKITENYIFTSEEAGGLLHIEKEKGTDVEYTVCVIGKEKEGDTWYNYITGKEEPTSLILSEALEIMFRWQPETYNSYPIGEWVLSPSLLFLNCINNKEHKVAVFTLEKGVKLVGFIEGDTPVEIEDESIFKVEKMNFVLYYRKEGIICYYEKEENECSLLCFSNSEPESQED